MIQSFKNPALRRFFEDGDRSKLPAEQVDRLRTILSALDVAERTEDLDQPSFRLHRLKGKMRDFWSITVRANWRIVFRFQEANVSDVDYLDYH